MQPDLIKLTEYGLYCEQGDFFIDPWQPVERAIITHAHSDHAREGSGKYLFAKPGEHIMRARLGTDASFETLDYGASLNMNGLGNHIKMHFGVLVSCLSCGCLLRRLIFQPTRGFQFIFVIPLQWIRFQLSNHLWDSVMQIVCRIPSKFTPGFADV